MQTNQRNTRDNISRTSHGSRRYSARVSEKGSRYREKAQNYYTNFNSKSEKGSRALSSHNGDPRTPTHHINHQGGGYNANLAAENRRLENDMIKLKGLNYLDKKGLLSTKVYKRYYKDNDLTDHLKVNKKQLLKHNTRVGENQLRVRYPKQMMTLYQEEYEKKRSCVGGKTQVFNRDKEKKFFQAQPISNKTTKQMDFTGEQVPYERVKKSRPATSYGPFI